MFSPAPGPRVYRIVAIAALLHLLLAARAAAQQPTITAGLGFSQIYLPQSWSPVVVDLRNPTDRAIDGIAVISLADETAPARVAVAVTVPPHAVVRTTLWAYFPSQPKLSAQQRKQGIIPPLSVVEWRGKDGALLTRDELHGIPISSASTKAAAESDTGAMVLLVDQRNLEGSESYEITSLMAYLAEDYATPIHVAAVEPRALPREVTGLSPCMAIALEAVDPASFDQAQQRALLDYVRGGGVLILAAPIPAAADASSWLAPLIPVQLIGSREAKQIELTADVAPLTLRSAVPIVEAVAGDGDVLLRSNEYVHAASKRFGLGKVIFTSFPINALEEKQPQVALLWEQLLSMDAPPREIAATRLATARHDILASMVGRKVAPWGLAGAFAGAYLLIILVAQGIFLGLARPKAVVVSVAAAVLMAGTLVAMGMTRSGGDNLQAARLAVIDVTANGGGTRQESLAFIGADDPEMALQSNFEVGAIRPAISDRANPPTIRQQPFGVEKAGVFSQRIERVWEASSPLAANAKLQAIGRFGPQGFSLEVDNGLGAALQAPMLIAERRAMAMDDLPAGRTTVSSFRIGARGDFAGAGVVTSEQDKRRGHMIKASLTSADAQPGAKKREQPPMLIGWIDEDASAATVRPARDVAQSKSMVLVRTPLVIEPPATRTKVSLPAPLVKLDSGILLYDAVKGESVPSQETGQWLVRFYPPREVGQLRPTSATLELRVSLPAHALSVYKSQVSDGRPKINRNADPIAEMSREVGLKKITFDCGPSDADRDGGVCLLLEVMPLTGQTGGSWQIKDLSLTLDAEVVAPPKPVVLQAPLRPINTDDER